MNTSKNETEPALLTPLEFAKIFRKKDKTWAYRQCWNGNIEVVYGYGRMLIPRTEVDRLLAKKGRYLGPKRKLKDGGACQP